MFESLADKLQNVFGKLRAKGALTEADVAEAMREVRLGLLEADVNFKVVKDFVARIRDRAVGVDILEGLHPAQQVIKIVDEELTAYSAASRPRWSFRPARPRSLCSAGCKARAKRPTQGSWRSGSRGKARTRCW